MMFLVVVVQVFDYIAGEMINKARRCFTLVTGSLLGASFAFFQLYWAMAQSPPCTLSASLESTIGANSLDYIERALARADEHHCSSILLKINPPAGSLQTTRMIVEKILASPMPFLCLVEPAGRHAG